MDEAPTQSSFSALIQSDLFTFYIGEKKKAFVVHSSAVAATSGPFRALVNGDLVEAKERSAELKDVEPDDFVRFLEYAYRHDYTVPSWVHDESTLVVKEYGGPDDHVPPPPEEAPELEEPTPEDVPGETVTSYSSYYASQSGAEISKEEAKGRLSVVDLRIKFYQHKYIGNAAPSAEMVKAFEPTVNSTSDQDFTPIFLAHARLYTFADMRLIYPLKSLTLHKLQQTLIVFRLCKWRVGDVVKLARYAYDQGPDRSKTGSLDELRQLVVEYMACKVRHIGEHKDFKALLEEGGEFVADFWRVVSKYLLKV